MSGIAFQQLRTVANPGLEGDGAGNVVGSIRVKATTGLALSASGIGVDTGSGAVTLTGGTWTYGSGSTLSVVGSSFSANEVPNADWVSTQIATGVSWGFPVLDAIQLDDTGDALRQSIVLYFDGVPDAGDTIIITDGTPETWTGVVGASAANQFSVDTGADEAMTDIAARITADSAKWGAVVVTALNSINNGSGSSTAGTVIVIYRKTQSATSFTDRIYGVWATVAEPQIVDFTGEDSYTKTASINLPAADPGAFKSFGPGKATADLTSGEAHVALNGDSQYVWDADSGTWTQISGTGSIVSGAGLTKSGNTLNINSGTGNLNGISVLADAIGLALGSSGGLKITSNELFIEPVDFAGTGLEDDGSDNLRLATQGTGIGGGNGTTLNFDATAADGNGLTGVGNLLAVTPDSTSGGNIEPVSVVANGVGVNITNIAGTGIEADGSANLRIAAAAAGAGLTGGAGVALAVDGTEANMKTPARVRTTANVNVTAGSSPDAVDGVTMAVGDRILIGAAEQTVDSECGIYEVTILGAGVDDATWVRAADAPAASEAAGWYIQVLEGSTHGDSLFRVDANLGGATTGTDGWSLATFSGADTTRSAGDGLVDGTGLNLDVQPDSTTAGNMLPVTVGANGVGVDISAITGTGIEADGSANLRVASQGNGIAGGTGSTLSVDPATEVLGSRAAVYVGADGVGVQLDNSTLTHATSTLAIKAAGVTETELNTSVAGGGLAGGGGTVLSVGVENGLAVSANAVGIDLTGGNGAITYSGTASHTYPVGTTAVGLFATGTPTDANHVVNKTYVDNNISGLVWLEPVVCIDFHGNQTYAQLEALTPGHSDSYVATTAGTLTAGTLAVVAGDVVEYDGAAWIKLVSGVGGFVATGTRLVLIADGDALVGPYTDPGDRGKIAVFDGTSLTGVLTTASTNDAVLVVGSIGETQPVDDNRAYVNEGGAGGSASWIQFSGGGTTNAGTGLTLDGNTLNVNATAVTNTNPTMLVQTDSIEVKYEAAGAGAGGLKDVAAGLAVNVEAAGSATGGLATVAGGIRVLAATAAGIELTASGVAVNLEADGVGTGGLAFTTGEIGISIDVTGGATLASVMKLTANGLSIGVDDSTLEETAAGGNLQVKAQGITATQLGADAATITKINLRWYEESIDDTGWTLVSGSVYEHALTAVPVIDPKTQLLHQMFFNGIADKTNNNLTDPIAASQYRFLDSTGGKIRVFGNPATSGDTFLVRYAAANS